MPTPMPRYLSCTLILLLANVAHAQDLHFQKNISVGGNVISSTETSIKGARERTVTQTPVGNTITIRQCDLKRTVTINEAAQAYFVAPDPQDDAAARAAAMVTGMPEAEAGDYITETSTITDTGERKTIDGYSARHLKVKVFVQPSKNACSQQSQDYEVDGWYADIAKEISSCQQSLPPVRESAGCSDRVVHKHTGSAKLGYPLNQTITLHNGDGGTTQVGVQVTEITKQDLDKALFDVPAGYTETKSLAELSGMPALQGAQPAPTYAAAQPSAPLAPAQQHPAGSSKFPSVASLMHPAAQLASMQNASAMGMQMMAARAGNLGPAGAYMAPGMQRGGAPVAAPQVLGPKAPGKIRIGVAPPDAQLGQGSNAGADYSTPIRNVEVALMSGPAVEIAALESHVPMQLQAEAQQNQCDYVMYFGVIVKHSSGGGFGKFMKIGQTAASFNPAVMMTKSVGSIVAAQGAAAAAQQMAAQQMQQQAISQLAGFNGQIKSKDDVTVQYQLVATGQNTPLLQNTLQGKAKSDGEDVLTPLLQQTANAVLTQVSHK
jgi:hypothetical protein